jgi:hypothetical protein
VVAAQLDSAASGSSMLRAGSVERETTNRSA